MGSVAEAWQVVAVGVFAHLVVLVWFVEAVVEAVVVGAVVEVVVEAVVGAVGAAGLVLARRLVTTAGAVHLTGLDQLLREKPSRSSFAASVLVFVPAWLVFASR